MSRASSRAVFATGLITGLISALLFLAGIFEPLETKLYDRWLRTSEPHPELSSIVVVTLPSADATAAASAIDAVRDASGIVFGDPLTGTPDQINVIAQKATDHGGVIFTAPINPKQRRQLMAGRLPDEPISAGEALDRAALAVAFDARLPGHDGVLRRFTPSIGGAWELGVAIASASVPGLVDLPRQAPMLGEARQLGPSPRLLIPFDHYSFSRVPIEEVASGSFSVRDKIVVISLPGDSMKWRTPVGELDDTDVTMTIATALLQGRELTRAPILVVVAAVLILCGVLTFGRARRRPVLDAIFPLLGAGGVFVLSGIAIRSGTWIDALPLMFALALQSVFIPVVSRIPERNAIPRDSMYFFDCLLKLLQRGCFAESGRLWVIRPEGAFPVAGAGPERLVDLVPEAGASELNRDEGQLVVLALGAGDQRIGAVLTRRRSRVLTHKRLDLVRRMGDEFAAQLGRALGRESRNALIDALIRSSRVLDVQDHFSAERPNQIAEIATRIAETVKLSPEEIEMIRLASYVHDVGKIGVPETILDTGGRLTDEDYEAVKRHALISQEILEAGGFHEELCECVGAHHERWDGRGYPQKLRGESIPIQSRILAVADAYVSMISYRPYRKGLSKEFAIEEIASQRARMFDPQVVEAMLAQIETRVPA